MSFKKTVKTIFTDSHFFGAPLRTFGRDRAARGFALDNTRETNGRE
jgi:hypothetical protein